MKKKTNKNCEILRKKLAKSLRLFESKNKAANWIRDNCHQCQKLLSGWRECRLSYYMQEGLTTRNIPKSVIKEIGVKNNKLVDKCLKFEGEK